LSSGDDDWSIIINALLDDILADSKEDRYTAMMMLGALTLTFGTAWAGNQLAVKLH